MSIGQRDLPHSVTFAEASVVWARIGFLSFGGPAGQIALMHRELVEQRRWVSEERFLHALNYCMLLPGPEAQQLAIYIGWLLHRTAGGLVAGVLFVLPGACLILALSALYAHFQHLPTIAALFFGLKAAVLAIVAEAVVRVGKRAIRNTFFLCVAAAAFVALFAFDVPFPWVIAAAAIAGPVAHRIDTRLVATTTTATTAASGSASVVDALFGAGRLTHTQPSVLRLVRVIALGLALWFAPIAALEAWRPDSVFVDQAWFFSQAAIVTFGGAYSVLSYVAQRAVEDFGWLQAGEMLDGLALAETTPGPLILVLQFVAYLGAFRAEVGLSPGMAGVVGSAIMLWTTFVPCFVWIFAGAPYIEALRNQRVLSVALACITAAVVGVILNLSVWFAMHTLFESVQTIDWGPIHLDVPVLSTLDVAAMVLTLLAAVATFRWKLPITVTLTGAAIAGLIWSFL